MTNPVVGFVVVMVVVVVAAAVVLVVVVVDTQAKVTFEETRAPEIFILPVNFYWDAAWLFPFFFCFAVFFEYAKYNILYGIVKTVCGPQTDNV